MVARAVAAACLVLGVLASVGGAQAASRPAANGASDLVLTGGKIFTADSARLWAQALAIRGERILAVGTDAEVRRLAARGTREIALGGRVVIPGINDAHDHVGAAVAGVEISLGDSPTPDPAPDAILDSLRRAASRTSPGTWLMTTIGLRVLDDTAVRRVALDRVAPDHPVLLWAWWGHGMLLNTVALRALGIADSASDPLGGWYERDARGHLTGRLDEYAEWSALRVLYSSLPERALVAQLRSIADASLRMGVTTVQNMAGHLEPELMVRVLREAQLPMRVRLIRWSMPNASGRNEQEWNVAPGELPPRVTISGRKWILDATPIERFALRRQPYAGQPGWYGRLDFPLDTIRAMLAEALRPGAAQLHLHIAGDSTSELVLAAMQALAPDSVWRPLRVRFEHGAISTDSQIARARRLGIVISQPRESAPLRTWERAGIPLAYGSDGLRNPFYNMMTVITGGARPAEALTREEAVRMYTLGSAYAEFAEREKGTIAPGMLADVAVLSQDIFLAPAAQLPATTSVLTIVGGRIVRYELTRTTRSPSR